MRILLFITKHIEGVLPRIQPTTINDSLRFRFAAHARFVNAPALTRLWLEQAPAIYWQCASYFEILAYVIL